MSKQLSEISSERIKRLEKQIKNLKYIYENKENLEEFKNEQKIIKGINTIENIIIEIIKLINLEKKEDKIELIKDIINYINNNIHEYNKNINNEIYKLINLIEDISNKIYILKEDKNLENNNNENYIKIGEEKLNNCLKIDSNLQYEINSFMNKDTVLQFNFVKLKDDCEAYDKIKLFDTIYDININSHIILKVDKELHTNNDFESKEFIELIKGENKIILKMNINIHQTNNYIINIDKINNNISVDIVYYSNDEKLLPEYINLCEKKVNICDSLYNMKRIVLLNLGQNDLENHLKTYDDYNKMDKKKKFSCLNLHIYLLILLVKIKKKSFKNI